MSVGIDIVQLNRLSLEEKFIQKVLSKKEIEFLNQRKDKLAFLAGRWAIKEAFIKAFKKDKLSILDLNKIEVFNDENGSPFIIFHQTKYENISISHEKQFAVGIVII